MFYFLQFLDQEVATQQKKNPKHVTKQRERALKQAEHNIKRYEHLQQQAAKQAEKQQKKIHSQTVR
jgi:hypothetical protein